MTFNLQDIRKHQWDIVRAQGKYIFVHGGIGTFKTTSCIMKIVFHCMKYGNQFIQVLAQTHDQLQKVFVQEWEKLVPPEFYHYRTSPTKKITLPQFNSVLYLQYADHKEAKARITGQNTTGYYMIQAETFRNPDLFTEIEQRCRIEPTDPSIPVEHFHLRLLDANAGSPIHFINKLFVDKTSKKYLGKNQIVEIFLRTTPETSIYKPQQLEDFRKVMTASEWQRRIEGQWVSQEGLYFDKFSMQDHVSEFEVDPSWPVYLGIDWGYKDPMAVIWVAVDNDSRLWVFDELYQTELETHEAAEEVVKRWKDMEIHGAGVDSAEANTWRTFRRECINRDRRIKIGRPKKDRKYNNELVRKCFQLLKNGSAKIQIHPNCVNLIHELLTIQWAETRDGRPNKEVPQDFDNHAVDALSYCLKAFLERRV